MLKGIKVVSFTHYLQGPSAVQMLADAGAEVVKIEPPKGAFERHWSGHDAFLDGVSVFFLLANRNQRSISLDLRSEEGKVIALKLIGEADVLVENYRPGVLDKLGFGYEAMKALNPGLVYCSCTGYGSDGPYVQRPGQDLLLQAMSGLAMLSGDGDRGPVGVGSAIVDQHAAILAAFGVTAALLARQHSGLGRRVESNLLNAALDLQIEPFNYYLNKGELWPRSTPAMGSRFHPAPYGIYRTADGWIAISLSAMEPLSAAFAEPELKDYSKHDQSYKREEIHARIAKLLLGKGTEQWFAIFTEHGIWHAPVNDYAQVEQDPQVQWNRSIVEFDYPRAGKVRLLNHPLRYDGEVPPLRRPPPLHGEHSREILEELGYDAEAIDALLQRAVVIAAEESR
ncbi:CaiB/BaiF CoA transferase family protein [Phytopseudomonas dryadis]|uniref:CoA transferase n=1 Tax=Phytopseudomonas dryadis TaxID=2487520 RepID=A0A4Q9QWK7_9GAMM|nr:CoA transferase [Pseudomonas dryadis]TBU87441.1 CoA transferase [Pseudomonas dryadis]